MAASQSSSKENTKGFEHPVSKNTKVLTSGKENTKDFDYRARERQAAAHHRLSAW